MKAAKVKLELAQLLHSPDAGACRACGVEMTRRLQKLAAVSQAHVEGAPETGLRLCVHYDASKEPKKRIHILAAQMASQVVRQREHIALDVGDVKHEMKRLRG